jgi:Flp pilus assembly protein TadG
MRSVIRRFLSDLRGNVTIIFALGGIPMLAAIGAAVDYGRASASDTVVQAATDAAAIAAAADPKMTDAKMTEIVNSYLTANGIDKSVVKISKVDVTNDKKTGTVAVKVSGQFDTSIMNLVGISSLEIGGFSEVQSGGNALEVALVLDNTFSMSAQGRLTALKSASHTLLNQLYSNSGPNSDIKVSIVPFSEYVNVGMSNRHEPWIDVRDDYSEVLDDYIWTEDLTDCHMEMTDGVAGTEHRVCNWVRGALIGTYTKNYVWQGCVGSRGDTLDTQIDRLATRYAGLLDGTQRGWETVKCGSPITPLTASRPKLESDIDAMILPADAETYIPAGLLWGWNMLDAADPFIGARTAAQVIADRGSKALVLMTDGDNTLRPDYPGGPWHVPNAQDPNWGSVANDKTAQLCDNIKAAGILIYTVSLKVTNSASLSMLTNCASSTSMAFNADNNTALVESFKQIASQLAAVHITK